MPSSFLTVSYWMDNFKKTADEDQFEAMVKQVKESLGANDQILLKGSNSMNLAKLVESLENEHN